MKKIVAMALCALLCGTAAFAEIGEFQLSAGAGGLFGMGLGGGVEASVSGVTLQSKEYAETIGGGGFVFLDATFAELAVGFSTGSSTITIESPGSSDNSKGTFSALDFSLLGQIPFVFDTVSVFPLLGIDYQLVLSEKDSDGDEYKGPNDNGGPIDFSSLWINLGIGADLMIGDILYIRGEFLYGIRLQNKFESDIKDTFKASGFSDAKDILGHGPSAKLAVGFKF
jgi:hypothetical protein